MKKVLVIFGGKSSEHDVSTVSAASVIANIPKSEYLVYMLGITKDGRWLLYEGDPAQLPGDKWLKSGRRTPALISTDSSSKGLLLFEKDGASKHVDIDAVFPVLHGKNGEDGTIQGLLTLAEIPFVGCATASSAVCMDKVFTNILADSIGVPQTKWMPVFAGEFNDNPQETIFRAVRELGFPIFVKPANYGSSVGISKAKNTATLRRAIDTALRLDSRIVLEAAVAGAEVECAVLGNSSLTVSTPGEIVPCNDFYDYNAKYVSDSELHIPARFDAETLETVRSLSAKIFKAAGCKGMARVDFFVRKSDGAVMFNEINTIPGFTSISMYPKMLEADGIAYPELLSRLIESASY